MSDVLSKVKILEDLIKIGREDEVISKTIDKLTLYKLDTLKKDLEDIENKIFILEKNIRWTQDNSSRDLSREKWGMIWIIWNGHLSWT